MNNVLGHLIIIIISIIMLQMRSLHVCLLFFLMIFVNNTLPLIPAAGLFFRFLNEDER